ncbi:MAG: DUF2779 domain-containing protein [bacterium]
MSAPHYITKTSYIEGIKCPKFLWHKIQEPSKIPQDTAIDRIRKDDGQLVGEKARQLYPDGVRIARESNPEEMHARSMEALKLRKPLFEAGFVYANGYALADILVPAGKDEWELYEVKASTSIDKKTVNCVLGGSLNYYYADVAFQKYVYTGAGIKIKKLSIMHLNRDYIYDGRELILNELIKAEDAYAGINAHVPDVESNIGSLLNILAQSKPPEVKLGRYCKSCPLERECEKEFGLPAEGSVMRLRMDREGLRFKMLEEKIYKIGDIPLTPDIEGPKRVQIEAYRDGCPKIKNKSLVGFLKKAKYPAYFLDFETIAPAVPRYAETHTYQQIPFQFSLHIVEKKGEKPAHHGYLAPGDADHRPEIVSRLKKLLGDKGSIFAYNVSFERGRIEEACLGNAENEKWFNNNIRDRMIDLEEPFDKFYYYDPKQEGSTSIKTVYPVLAGGKGYEGFEIADGGDAMKKYMDITFKEVDEKTKTKVRADLEEYCRQDTMAMVEILDALGKKIGET